MSKLIPVIGGVTGVAVIGSTGAYYLLTQNTTETKKFSEVFQYALIKLDESENVLLKTKLEKLRKETPKTSIVKLQTAKNTTSGTGDAAGLISLKGACQEIYDSNFTDRESNIFKDFESYCARTNKDKVKNDQWFTDAADWKVRYGKLKDHTLTPELTEIKEKNSETGNELQAWCNKVGDLIFEGDTDLTHINAKAFCGKDN